MKFKKMIISAVITALCINTMTGCGQKKNTEEKPEQPMGRYVEQSIEMPDAVKDGKEIVFKMLKNPNGLLEFYGVDFEQEGAKGLLKYTLNNKEWKKEQVEWIKNAETVSQLVYGEDNLLYFITVTQKDEKSYWKLSKLNETENAEDVYIEDSEQPLDEMYSNMPVNLKVMDNHDILILYRTKCVLYHDGKKTYEMENGGNNFAVFKNMVLLNNSNNSGTVLYDLEQRTKIREIPFHQNQENTAYVADVDGTWYMAANSGIHRLSQNGTVWEIIADGSLNSLASPSYGINEMSIGTGNDYYIMLESGNGKREVKYYYYDKNVASIPDKTLSVVSLEENSLIRQAITEFQINNQDVKVEYKILKDNEGITASDAVKLLNTELLAGKGADVLILDSLPVSAYIEKGVLMELSDVIQPLIEKNELLPNIIESSKTNGKMFAVPTQIGVPIIYGKKEAVSAGSKSLADFAEYTVSKAKSPILGAKVYGNADLLNDFTSYYGAEFMDSSKVMDREVFAAFLENVKKIAGQMQTMEGSFLTEDMRKYSLMSSSFIVNNNAECGISEFKNTVDLYAPFEAIKQIDGTYSDIGSLYIPHSIAGINNASKEKELASDFVRLMLSEQIGKVGEGGFTINQKALESLITEPDDFYMAVENFSATRPEDQKIEEFVQLCKKLNVMSRADSFLLEMIKDEADSCLSGQKTAKEAAKQIFEKSKAYREE